MGDFPEVSENPQPGEMRLAFRQLHDCIEIGNGQAEKTRQVMVSQISGVSRTAERNSGLIATIQQDVFDSGVTLGEVKTTVDKYDGGFKAIRKYVFWVIGTIFSAAAMVMAQNLFQADRTAHTVRDTAATLASSSINKTQEQQNIINTTVLAQLKALNAKDKP